MEWIPPAFAAFRPCAAPSATLCLALLLSGCEGPQSSFVHAGEDAATIGRQFWVMISGAALIWAIVMGLALYAMLLRPDRRHGRHVSFWVIGGGVAFPSVVLLALLVWGLSTMPGLHAPTRDESADRIEVSGERWWWRVRYVSADGTSIESANELRLPLGRRIDIELVSPDVIHSFWIPSLGGKLDMIPGRRNRYSLKPTQLGVFNGVCAEYCGTAHAQMLFKAVVMPVDEFERWKHAQAEPAITQTGKGLDAFIANGCGACHTIRGTQARGFIGPDLTHVGGRLSLGAGILPMEAAALRRWITHTAQTKPGVLMPNYAMLPPDEIEAIAHYLDRLE